jgi:hypothetical protein
LKIYHFFINFYWSFIFTQCTVFIASFINSTYVKLAFLAVKHTDLSFLCNWAIVSFSFIMYNLFIPGACKNIISHLKSYYRFSFNISFTLIMCFFSFSLRIWEPIDFILDPDCLSLFHWRYPAFLRHTYFLSDWWLIHLDFS